MSYFRRAVWADDQTVTQCTKCKVEFNYRMPKHHCRKCGLIFCHECSHHKLIVPKEALVPRPVNWMKLQLIDTAYDEDNHRCPQRVCDTCADELEGIQPELRLLVSKAHQETVISESRLPNLPSIDFHLENEIGKATTMLLSFKNVLGEDMIPRELLDIAKGVVFFTVVKVGFMLTGRYGTGLVVAKLGDNKTWSAPSAVAMSGLGWGLQIGAELTDVMLILTTEYAVNTFKSRAQISVGAELGVSVGPIGRSIESEVTAGNKGATHAFSYAQSKGLFVGASLEASGIVSRPDVNRAFYGEKISAGTLLSGEYPPPRGVAPLYKAINDILFRGNPQDAVAEDETVPYSSETFSAEARKQRANQSGSSLDKLTAEELAASTNNDSEYTTLARRHSNQESTASNNKKYKAGKVITTTLTSSGKQRQQSNSGDGLRNSFVDEDL